MARVACPVRVRGSRKRTGGNIDIARANRHKRTRVYEPRVESARRPKTARPMDRPNPAQGEAMFERFDNAAKRGVVLAQEHAKEYRSNAVEPEHMALAYLSFHDHFGWLTGVIGFTVEQLSDALAEAMPAIDTDLPKPTEHIRLAPATKEVFERCLGGLAAEGQLYRRPTCFHRAGLGGVPASGTGTSRVHRALASGGQQFGLDYQGLRDAVAVACYARRSQFRLQPALLPQLIRPSASRLPRRSLDPTVRRGDPGPDRRAGRGALGRTRRPATTESVPAQRPERRTVRPTGPSASDHHDARAGRSTADHHGIFRRLIRGRASRFGRSLVLGPQRSRKTTSIAVPSLLEWPGSSR